MIYVCVRDLRNLIAFFALKTTAVTIAPGIMDLLGTTALVTLQYQNKTVQKDKKGPCRYRTLGVVLFDVHVTQELSRSSFWV